MSTDNERAATFVGGYGRTWENWDAEGFVALFTADVIYVVHPTQETVVGSEALTTYFRKEEREQGVVGVRMGTPIVAGDQVAAEFWVESAADEEKPITIVGCFLARLDPVSGRCSEFREYWFDLEGRSRPFPGWGE